MSGYGNWTHEQVAKVVCPTMVAEDVMHLNCEHSSYANMQQVVKWVEDFGYHAEICDNRELIKISRPSGKRINVFFTNKTQDMMRDYASYINNGGEWYSDAVEIKSLCLRITAELEADNQTQYLEASIRWCYSTSTAITERFEASETGFKKACRWLDAKRVEFAKKLL